MKNQLLILCSIIFTTAHSMQQYPLIPEPMHPIDLNKISEYFRIGTDHANRTKSKIQLPPQCGPGQLDVRKIVRMLHDQVPYLLVIPIGQQKARLILKKEFTEELRNIYHHYYKQFHAYKPNDWKIMGYFFSEVSDNIALALRDQGHPDFI
jgi:hypothetical protein